MVFCKRYIAWAKNFGRSFILWHWRVMASLGENWLLVSYSAQKKIFKFLSSEPQGPNFKFDGMVFSKRYIGLAKNCGRSFILLHWKPIESFGKKSIQVSNSAQKKSEFCLLPSFGPLAGSKKFHNFLVGWIGNYISDFAETLHSLSLSGQETAV